MFDIYIQCDGLAKALSWVALRPVGLVAKQRGMDEEGHRMVWRSHLQQGLESRLATGHVKHSTGGRPIFAWHRRCSHNFGEGKTWGGQDQNKIVVRPNWMSARCWTHLHQCPCWRSSAKATAQLRWRDCPGSEENQNMLKHSETLSDTILHTAEVVSCCCWGLCQGFPCAFSRQQSEFGGPRDGGQSCQGVDHWYSLVNLQRFSLFFQWPLCDCYQIATFERFVPRMSKAFLWGSLYQSLSGDRSRQYRFNSVVIAVIVVTVTVTCRVSESHDGVSGHDFLVITLGSSFRASRRACAKSSTDSAPQREFVTVQIRVSAEGVDHRRSPLKGCYFLSFPLKLPLQRTWLSQRKGKTASSIYEILCCNSFMCQLCQCLTMNGLGSYLSLAIPSGSQLTHGHQMTPGSDCWHHPPCISNDVPSAALGNWARPSWVRVPFVYFIIICQYMSLYFRILPVEGLLWSFNLFYVYWFRHFIFCGGDWSRSSRCGLQGFRLCFRHGCVQLIFRCFPLRPFNDF